MKTLALLAAGVMLAGTTAFAAPPNYPQNGFIGVFGDAAGTNCCVTTGAGSTTLYVIAVTGGNTSAGLTGAEFRIELNPPAPSAFVIWTPSPSSNVALGNPVDNSSAAGDVSGCNLAFSTCQKQAGMAGDHITLGTLVVFNLTGEHEMLVKKHNRPSNPNLTAPLVILCDAPNYTAVPLTLFDGDPWLQGGEAYSFRTPINAAACNGSCGFVGVEAKTWTTMKDLYR
jgi:hypothetical protein